MLKYNSGLSQTDSRRLHTVQSPVLFQLNPCESRGGQSGSDEGFSPSNSILSCQYYSAITPQSSSSCFFYQKDKPAKPGNLAKGNALLKVGERLIEK